MFLLLRSFSVSMSTVVRKHFNIIRFPASSTFEQFCIGHKCDSFTKLNISDTLITSGAENSMRLTHNSKQKT
jgi:hypothetical protein